MSSRALAAALVLAVAATPAGALSAVRGNATLQIPITQVVSIDGVEVFSQSVGQGLLNACQSFAPSAVKSPEQPVVEVCGTQTKVTVFLRNRCESYHSYQADVGACDTKQDTATCKTETPATMAWLQTAQSYIITQCATGTQR